MAILSRVAAGCILLLGSLCAAAQTPQREKVAEGKYLKTKNGQAIAGTDQDWTVWRNPDGSLAMEDKFVVTNPAAELTAKIEAGTNKPLGASLRHDVENAVRQTGLQLTLSPDRTPRALTVTGNLVLSGKPVEALTCDVQSFVTTCKGLHGKRKLASKDPLLFFYSFPFPMLLSPVILHANLPISHDTTMKFAVATLNEDSIELDEADAELRYLDNELLQVGDRKIGSAKYSLEVPQKDAAPLKLTFWAAANGLVLAVDIEGIPGTGLLLVQYKKYSDY